MADTDSPAPSSMVQKFQVDIAQIATLIKTSDEVGADISEGRRLLLIAINMGKTSRNFEIIAKYLAESRALMEGAIEDILVQRMKTLQDDIAARKEKLPAALEVDKKFQVALELFKNKKYKEVIDGIKVILEDIHSIDLIGAIEKPKPVKAEQPPAPGPGPIPEPKAETKSEPAPEAKPEPKVIHVQIQVPAQVRDESGKPAAVSETKPAPSHQATAGAREQPPQPQKTDSTPPHAPGVTPQMPPPTTGGTTPAGATPATVGAGKVPPSGMQTVSGSAGSPPQSGTQPPTQGGGVALQLGAQPVTGGAGLAPQFGAQPPAQPPASPVPQAVAPQQGQSTKSYVVEKSEETGKCPVCLGKIKPGLSRIRCSCGERYHEMCGKRLGKCQKCGTSFT